MGMIGKDQKSGELRWIRVSKYILLLTHCSGTAWLVALAQW